MMLTSLPRLTVLPLILIVSTNVLLIAWLYKVFNRPEVPNYLRELDPHKHGFPSWYGGWESYSPYDPVRPINAESVEVLLFVDMKPDSPSLPAAIQLYDALVARPNTVVKSVAPFSPDWNDQLDTARNLDTVGCSKIVWRIGEDEGGIGNACPGSIFINELGSHSRTVPKIVPRSNITLLPEPHQLLAQGVSYESLAETFGPDWQMGLLAQVNPGTDPKVYWPEKSHVNHRAVTYFPHPATDERQWPRLPTRGKLHYSIHSQGAPEPSRRSLRADGNPFDPSSNLRGYYVNYERNTGSSMQRAGICIFENWKDGVLDINMAQAMLSGCLVATVPPDVKHGDIQHLIIPLKKTSDRGVPSAQIEEFVSKLSDKEFKRMLVRAFIFARQEFVGAVKADSVLDIVDRYKKGARGYLFPNSFRWTCESNGERPMWCEPKEE